jgi:hypothetical protein
MMLFPPEMKSSDTDQISLSSIKSIAADCLLTIRPRQGETHGQVMFGASRARFEFNQDVEWQKAIKSLFTGATEIEQDNRLMFEANIECVGPLPMRICPLNSREVAVNSQSPEKQDTSSKWLTPSDADRQHTWSQDWDTVAGGLFTVLMTRETSDQKISDVESPGIEQVNLLGRTIDLIAVGVDFLGKSEKFVMVVRLGCKQGEDPEVIATGLQQLIALSREDFLEQTEPPKDSEDAEGFQFNQMIFQGLEHAKSRIVRGERNTLELRMELKLPEVWVQAAAEADRLNRVVNAVKPPAEPLNDAIEK